MNLIKYKMFFIKKYWDNKSKYVNKWERVAKVVDKY